MTTIYYGTNRNPISEQTGFGTEFSTNGLADLRFGKANINNQDKVESITTYPDGAKLGSGHLFSKLQKQMRKKTGDVLIFMHGFNVTFKGALETAAVLQKGYKIPDQPPLNLVTFSWPANGKLLHYHRDRHDAKASGLAVARGLMKLAKFLREMNAGDACQRNLHLLAHSMGCYVLRRALRELKKEFPRRLPRLFDQIILAAADEDDDAFEHDHKLAQLPELANRITVYSNREDKALTLSDWTKGNPDRLGSDGPRLSRMLHTRIELVDCTKIVRGVSEHHYYHKSDRVVQDIVHVLAGHEAENILGRNFLPRNNRFLL
uniref:Esterase/lipase superfamily enzyme n=1 Tax=Candidatus Kentrum sp. LFY TaxID=2126342 RepID=A0A450WLY0_9GAMM|nr:MAG: Esterase/lipase superfamily enzyme [Candidatus Kentron sp. LFY]